MNDLVVLIPGILGSELRRTDGQLLWGFPDGGRDLLRPRHWLRESAAQLILSVDSPTEPYLDDGVRATALVSVPQVISGFAKTDGYDQLRERLFESFQMEAADDGVSGNYLEFPYDWRRDNRAAAHRLGRAVSRALSRWREVTGLADAKVIYLCHSMGGLVARYHLEVLGGWSSCRALVTMGTPYRGSVNALNFLVAGYKAIGVDMTELLRSSTAVYQLLPIYPLVDVGGKYHRVVELGDLPHVSQARARDARAFHDEINNAVRTRPTHAYPIFYFSGIGQPTLQSATLEGHEFAAVQDVPESYSPYYETGDGTVPYVSSIPIELSNDSRGGYVVPTCHAMLQSCDAVWIQLETILNRLQDRSLHEVLLSPGMQQQGPPPSISLELADMVDRDPLEIRGRIDNARGPRELEAKLQLANVGANPRASLLTVNGVQQQVEWRTARSPEIGPFSLVPDDLSGSQDTALLRIEGLPTGIYRVLVQAVSRLGAPDPVEDVFVLDRTGN